MPHDCKFEDKLIEMAENITQTTTNVTWLKEDAERRNGMFFDHIKESDNFRSQVTRNTIWRWVYKGGFITVFTILAWMVVKLFEMHNK